MHKVSIVYNEAFLRPYDTVDCESPDRVAAIWTSIEDMADPVEARPCSVEDVLACHSPRLVQSVARDQEVYRAALLAAGGAIQAAGQCLVSPSFACVRPPGHHAGRNFNGGFCFFNNMAIAVTALLASGRVDSVLIIDIDLHYGNGTDDILRNEPRVAFRNIEGATRDAFFREFEAAAGEAQRYDVVACSVGFDTYVRDWGGLLFTDDYRRIGATLASSAAHLFSVLEGGYYIPDLGKNARAYLEGTAAACS
jgi:acetoin utilization deacetylase AcuC-like enzyme